MKHWEDLSLETTERFGGTLPHPDTAQTIAAVYQRAPHAVERAIDRVALEYEQGAIRSPWGVLKSRVGQITAGEHATRKADDTERLAARAEQRIRNELLHYDRWPEAEDELFGERGTLKEHPQLKNRMHTIWTQHRPAGELVELEAEQRAEHWRQQRARQNAA